MFDPKKLDVQFQRAEVGVPEFAGAITGDTLVVRELTADEKRAVARQATIQGEAAYFDTAQVVVCGTVQGSVDDLGKGKPVFTSETQLRDLPGRYDAPLVRLANRILELSGMVKPAQPDEAELNQDELEKKA